MGRRAKYDKCHGEFPAHSLPLASMGAGMLLTGWLGFNAGSAFSAGFVATQATVNTVLGASAGAVTWALLSLVKNRKRIDPLFVLNGMIVGLAGITPCSGYVPSWAAAVIGVILGVSSFLAGLLQKKLRIDDALEVGPIHGVPGIVGSIAIGFFASTAVNPAGADGVFFGGGRQLWVQLVGIGVTMVWTAIITLPLIWLFRRMDWFSLQPQHEALGLDGKDHLLRAYRHEEDGPEESPPNMRKIGVNPIYHQSTMSLLPQVDLEDSSVNK